MPDHWVEKLFQKFEDFYGSRWAAQYGAFPRERVKATWAEELAGFECLPEAISRALEAQKQSEYPPTLPAFLAQCRAAAKSIPKQRPLGIEQKLTGEELERNRARLKSIAEQLGRRMARESID